MSVARNAARVDVILSLPPFCTLFPQVGAPESSSEQNGQRLLLLVDGDCPQTEDEVEVFALQGNFTAQAATVAMQVHFPNSLLLEESEHLFGFQTKIKSVRARLYTTAATSSVSNTIFFFSH